MNSHRISLIRARLIQALSPQELEISDESHLHAGHEGAKEGKGHFRVTIISEQFAGLSPIKRHRLVYDAVGDLMETDIHALAIDAQPPAQ